MYCEYTFFFLSNVKNVLNAKQLAKQPPKSKMLIKTFWLEPK